MSICSKRALVILLAGAASSIARADLTGLGFRITAKSGGAAATALWRVDDMRWDASAMRYTWQLPERVLLRTADGQVLATLLAANVMIDADPAIDFAFSVQSGGADTLIKVDSGRLCSEVFGTPWGQAAIGFTVTDVNGNGARLSPDPESGYVFGTFYNGGYTFADLIHTDLEASPGKSASVAEVYPAVDYAKFESDGVSDMFDTTHFVLSAHDLASGTSHFEIVPEPSTLTILFIVGVVLVAQRR